MHVEIHPSDTFPEVSMKATSVRDRINEEANLLNLRNTTQLKPVPTSLIYAVSRLKTTLKLLLVVAAFVLVLLLLAVVNVVPVAFLVLVILLLATDGLVSSALMI